MSQEVLNESKEKQTEKTTSQTGTNIYIDWSDFKRIDSEPGKTMDHFPSAEELFGDFPVDLTGKKQKGGINKPDHDSESYGDPNNQFPFTQNDIAKEGILGIDQSKYGDCVFEASLATISSTEQGQEIIANSITRSGDDFVVTFPGDKDNPVTVTKADLKHYDSQNSAPWAKIMETALAKGYPKLAEGDYSDVLPNGVSATPAQYAMNLLTGEKAVKIDADANNEVARNIENAMHNGDPVVAFCADDAGGALVSGHEWSVVDFDAQTNEITVRNPWGDTSDPEGKDGMTEIEPGFVKMPLETFNKYFKEVTWVPSDSDSRPVNSAGKGTMDGPFNWLFELAA
jgi:hypothetical protein